MEEETRASKTKGAIREDRLMAASIKNAGTIGQVQVTLPGCTPRIAAGIDDAARMVQEAIRAADLRDQRRLISLETREVTNETEQVNVGDGAIKPEGVFIGRELRPTLSMAQRQAITRGVRQSWGPSGADGIIVNDDPIFEQERPVQQQDPPCFDRPRRLISLENE